VGVCVDLQGELEAKEALETSRRETLMLAQHLQGL